MQHDPPVPDVSVLQQFLSTLASAKPERDLVALLNRLTQGEAAITAPWGETLAGIRHPDAARQGVHDEGQLLGEIHLHAPRDHPDLLQLAAETYALVVLRRQARIARASAQGETLLTELLSGARTPDLNDRLVLHGLHDESYALAAAAFPQRRARSRAARQQLASDLERIRTAGDAFLFARGHRVLSAVRGERVVWWWTTTSPDSQTEPFLAALTSVTTDDLRLGLSGLQHDPLLGGTALTQALLALSSTRAARTAAVFSTLDPLHWVLASQPGEHLALWRDALLKPLREADEDGRLLETLRAYLQDPDHKSALAQRLNIHPNTLRYRLARIEELLGQPLSHPATLARLYLALGLEG